MFLYRVGLRRISGISSEKRIGENENARDFILVEFLTVYRKNQNEDIDLPREEPTVGVRDGGTERTYNEVNFGRS